MLPIAPLTAAARLRVRAGESRMSTSITTGLEPIIEALRACRADLLNDNIRAERIAAARELLAEWEAELAAIPPQPPMPTWPNSLREWAELQSKRRWTAERVEECRQHLAELLDPSSKPAEPEPQEYVAFDPLAGGLDEDYPSSKQEWWDERISRESGIPLQGDNW